MFFPFNLVWSDKFALFSKNKVFKVDSGDRKKSLGGEVNIEKNKILDTFSVHFILL